MPTTYPSPTEGSVPRRVNTLLLVEKDSNGYEIIFLGLLHRWNMATHSANVWQLAYCLSACLVCLFYTHTYHPVQPQKADLPISVTD